MILRKGKGYQVGDHLITQLPDRPELGPSHRKSRDWAVVDAKGVITHWFRTLSDAHKYLTGVPLKRAPMALRVFLGSPDGLVDVVMAATSATAFCKATGCSRGHVSEIKNEKCIEQAMAEPGAIFSRKNGEWGEYSKVQTVLADPAAKPLA